MKTKVYYLVSILFLAFFIVGCTTISQRVEPSISKEEITSFSDAVSATSLLNTEHGSNNILVVLDIDNTILTSSVDLGGDIWYQWQREKLHIKPEESQKVKSLFEDSIGLLYELGPMKLTDKTCLKLFQTGKNQEIQLWR